MKDLHNAGHSTDDLNRFADIRDRLKGISPLYPTIHIDDVTGYYIVMIPSSTPQFYQSLEDAQAALPLLG